MKIIPLLNMSGNGLGIHFSVWFDLKEGYILINCHFSVNLIIQLIGILGVFINRFLESIKNLSI